MTNKLSSNGVLLRRAYQGISQLGIDADDVFRRCGFAEPFESTIYVSREDQLERHGIFWPVLADVSGDPCIGLHLGEKVPVMSGEITEYLFMSSPNFQEGLLRSAKYTRLISDLFHMQVEFDGDPCVISYNIPGIELATLDQVYPCVMVSNMRFFSQLTLGEFKPTLVRLTNTDSSNALEYERVFQCPVEFSAPVNCMCFAQETLQVSSLHADSNMFVMHEKMADEQILRLEKQELLARARRVIGGSLETGEVSLESLAARLGMKSSRLRAHFTELDTSFNQVLSDYRFELARKLLTQTDESIDQIVYLTGFSEPSTFYRAFKRWTGTTPIVYREQAKAGA